MCSVGQTEIRSISYCFISNLRGLVLQQTVKFEILLKHIKIGTVIFIYKNIRKKQTQQQQQQQQQQKQQQQQQQQKKKKNNNNKNNKQTNKILQHFGTAEKSKINTSFFCCNKKLFVGVDLQVLACKLYIEEYTIHIYPLLLIYVRILQTGSVLTFSLSSYCS